MRFNYVRIGDARELPLLSGSVDLIAFSPPYNVCKEYGGIHDSDRLDMSDYRKLLSRVAGECWRVLRIGGRVCVNIANTGRNPYLALNAAVSLVFGREGLELRGEIIWDKGASVGTSTAWGSWCSPSNPCLRDVHEYILVFHKGSPRLTTPITSTSAASCHTISAEDFTAWTKSIWRFPTESAKRIGHPSPFPVELPRRLIELYSYPGTVVLDPMCGSGTTLVAAKMLGRRWIGFDIVPEYVELAKERLDRVHDITERRPLPKRVRRRR